MSNFQPLEVVSRGSEAQLQVAENLNKLPCRIRAKNTTKRRHNVFLYLSYIYVLKQVGPLDSE